MTNKIQLYTDYDPRYVRQWGDYFVEPKIDGVRVNIRNGAAYSKSNILIRNVALQAAVDDWPDCDLEARIIQGSFEDTVSVINSKDKQLDDVSFYLIGLLDDGNYARLVRDFYHPNLNYLPRFLFRGDDDMDALHDRVLSTKIKGTELTYAAICDGIMIKHLINNYVDGRTYSNLKYKVVTTTELVVVDVEQVGGENRVLICTPADSDRYFTKSLRIRIASGLNNFIRTRKPNDLIGSTIEIGFNGLTPAGQPRFARLIRPLKTTF